MVCSHRGENNRPARPERRRHIKYYINVNVHPVPSGTHCSEDTQAKLCNESHGSTLKHNILIIVWDSERNEHSHKQWARHHTRWSHWPQDCDKNLQRSKQKQAPGPLCSSNQLAIIVWAMADLPFSAVPGNGRLAPHPLQSYRSSPWSWTESFPGPTISIKSKVILALSNRWNYSGIPTDGIQSNDIYSNNCRLRYHLTWNLKISAFTISARTEKIVVCAAFDQAEILERLVYVWTYLQFYSHQKKH